MDGIWIHLREAAGLALRRAPFTLVPPVVFALLLYASLAHGVEGLGSNPALGQAFVETYGAELQENLEKVPAALHARFVTGALERSLQIPLGPWLAGGLAVVVAAFGAFLALTGLIGDLRRGGLMTELLSAPLGGGALALAWLTVATVGGTLAGGLTLVLAASVGGVEPPFLVLPVLVGAAAIFAGLALLLWLALPARWLGGVRVYLLPLLTLPGVLVPLRGELAGRLVLVNPLHHAARVMHLLLWQGEGPNPFMAEALWSSTLVSLGLLATLPVGLWFFAVGFCRQGLGLRTRTLAG